MAAKGNTESRHSVTAQTDDPIARIPPENLGGILAAAADLTVMIAGDGTIQSLVLNERSSDLGKLDHWVGRSFRDFLTTESLPKFESLIERVRKGTYAGRPVELNHRDNAVWDFPIQYTLHEVSVPGTYLMIGRDLRPVAETQRQLVQAQIALERGYEAQREFDSRYRLLLATVTDAIVLVSLSDGRITDVNDHAADLLGSGRKELVGNVLATQFQGTRRGDLEASLTSAALSDGLVSLDLTVQRGGAEVTLFPSVFRVGGDRVAICRIVRRAAEPQAPSGALPRLLEALYAEATEAIVFTDAAGAIRSANDRFLAMIDAADLGEVKGRNIADFLSRGQVDFGVVSENTARSGHVRRYATEFVSDLGTRMPVELSAASLKDGAERQIAFVAREAGRIDAGRAPTPTPGATDSAAQQNILDLVGSASLKEIVAETNDVIEKLCIETAIRLTNNNRVAAAEMLGLSRQSLYVKLRKYDLVKKSEEE